MMSIGLFGVDQVGKFVRAKREQPGYFEFPFTTEDEIEIVLPDPSRVGRGYVTILRSMTHNLMLALQSQYPRGKGFHELVRSGDQELVNLAKQAERFIEIAMQCVNTPPQSMHKCSSVLGVLQRSFGRGRAARYKTQ